MSLLPSAEPTDCWMLVGDDDGATPPSVARLLHTVGTRAEWRRAGLPVLFDTTGEPVPVVRAGRAYRFRCVGEAGATSGTHPTPPA